MTLIRCAECGHHHPDEMVENVLDDGREMMCVWCARGDYSDDPEGDYRRGELPSFRVLLASPPHREMLVSEVWWGDEMWAEVGQDGGELTVEFFPRQNGDRWILDLDQAVAALTEAGRRLKDYDPRQSAFFKDMPKEEFERLFGNPDVGDAKS